MVGTQPPPPATPPPIGRPFMWTAGPSQAIYPIVNPCPNADRSMSIKIVTCGWREIEWVNDSKKQETTPLWRQSDREWVSIFQHHFHDKEWFKIPNGPEIGRMYTDGSVVYVNLTKMEDGAGVKELCGHIGTYPMNLNCLVGDRTFRKKLMEIIVKLTIMLKGNDHVMVVLYCNSGKHRSVGFGEILKEMLVEYYQWHGPKRDDLLDPAGVRPQHAQG